MLGKEQILQDLDRPAFDATLREYYDRNYHQLLPIIIEKVHQEKGQQEKLKAVKSRLNFEEVSQHSDSGILIRRRDLKKRLGSGQVHSTTGSHKPRRDCFESPRNKDSERRTMFKRMEKGVFHMLRDKGKSMSAYSKDSRSRSYHSSHDDTESSYQSSRSRETEFAFEKHHNKRASSRRMEALSKSEDSAGGHWKSKRKQQKSSIEDDLSGNPEDHLKIFQAAAKTERWAMPMWCHMFNFTLTGNDLCTESPTPIYMIKIPKSVDEMIRVTTSFLIGEVADSIRKRKKSLPSWKQQEARQKQNFMKGGFRNQQRLERKQDRFTLLTKTPKEILALDKEKFKPPPTMTTPVKKGKLSHLIKRLKQSNEKDQAKAAKKGENLRKGQATDNTDREEDGTERPMIIKSKIGGHFVHCIKVTIPIQQNHRKDRRPGVPQLVINQVTEEKIQVAIHPEYLEQTIAIGSTLTKKGRKELCGLLRRNPDIFAWKPTDMTGVSCQIAEHRLNIREGCLLVRQKKRGKAPERNKAIYEKVKKLVDAGNIEEVHYHSWLSNTLMVKRHDGSWRIYKGYHQIKIAKEDEEKTAFIISQGIFCYSKMSFGLKNAGATYQRLVDKAFQKETGHNLEVSVDNLVSKSRTKKEVIRDIEETFKTLKEINVKLNPNKCTFGMREGMFLRYKVNADGLKVCPDKVKAAHSIIVIIDQSMKHMLSNPEVTIRLLKWRFDLKEHDIHYRLRTSVKGRILVDFIMERMEDDPPDTPIED
uniref:Reverse transcriptase domain-containing protein n=1 Tax=Tanacetum cinerariifolium TaxID=118510 RepID=A0A6L2KGX2_TANCI|nr:reverse transcriptase domain-containing protein [Tanacetum cinerariifolium]